MNTFNMYLWMFLLLAGCCVQLGECSIYNPSLIVHTNYSGVIGETLHINTPNYDMMLPHDDRMTPDNWTISEDVHNLNKSSIFTFAITNRNISGTIKLRFLEYNLNPGSLIYVSILFLDFIIHFICYKYYKYLCNRNLNFALRVQLDRTIK